MKVKLFWILHPLKVGLFRTDDANAKVAEEEINSWLREHPRIRVTEIRQAATGGSMGPMLFLISVWYEEDVQ